MKKFLALSLAFVLIGTTVISFSDASRDAYHTYLYQQALQKRNERRFSAPQRAVVTETTKTKESVVRPTIQNLRYPRNKRNVFTGTSTTANMDLKLRPMSNTMGFAAERTPREKLTVKNLDATFLIVDTVATDDFSVALPRGWNPTVTESGVLEVGDGKTFEITVRKINQACENVSFQSCAINLSNDMNHLENVGAKINSLSRITRLTQRTDRILGTNTYTSTHTESFLGTYFGREVFITRYFVQEPGTTNLFLLETIADRAFASEAVVVAKRLSSSFRMITE
jgi:hypothetical protein